MEITFNYGILSDVKKADEGKTMFKQHVSEIIVNYTPTYSGGYLTLGRLDKFMAETVGTADVAENMLMSVTMNAMFAILNGRCILST